MKTNKQAKPRIIILGGGFGGLEAALSMRSSMPDEADITLVSDKEYFTYKPNTIYIPFGLSPGKLALQLSAPTRHRNISLIKATAREIDPVSGLVFLDRPNHLSDLPYDYLVVATGAGMRPDEVPGLAEFGVTLWTIEDMLSLRAAFRKLLATAKDNRKSSVLFLLPPNNQCSGPLYEMALMLDAWLRRKKVRDQVGLVFTTFEETYIQAFGPRIHDYVTQEFEHRGIEGHTRYSVDRIDPSEAVYKNGERVPFDLLVSFPPYSASTSFTQLPVDNRGFIATDLRTRQVVGYPNVYAVGDASDFPIKQADLAILQADAAADHLSRRVLAQVPGVLSDALSMAAAGGHSQPPREITASRLGPVKMRATTDDLCKVGSSPLWRLGRMALGFYLPWRFKANNPFNSEVPWKGLETGFKVIAGVTTR